MKHRHSVDLTCYENYIILKTTREKSNKGVEENDKKSKRYYAYSTCYNNNVPL